MSAGGARAVRLFRHSLSGDALQLIVSQMERGIRPAPVHLWLVDDGPPERGFPACASDSEVTNAWGEWITGASDQVTCPGCLETVHA